MNISYCLDTDSPRTIPYPDYGRLTHAHYCQLQQQCTPKREPRTQTQEPSKEQKAGSNKGKELKEQKSREGERVAEEVAVDAEAKLPISSPMKEPLTDSQSSSTTPLKKSKVFQVKRPTESPPPPPIAKKKTLEQGQGNNQQSTTTKLAHALGGSKELSTKDLNRDEESMETQSSAYPKDERTTQETVGLCGTSLISDVELTPVVESKPSVPARTVKSIPSMLERGYPFKSFYTTSNYLP